MSLARCAVCRDGKREGAEDGIEQNDHAVLPIDRYGVLRSSRGRLRPIAEAGAGDERDDGHRGTGTAATIADRDRCARQHLRSADAWQSHSRRGGAGSRAASHADYDSGTPAALTAIRSRARRSRSPRPEARCRRSAENAGRLHGASQVVPTAFLLEQLDAGSGSRCLPSMAGRICEASDVGSRTGPVCRLSESCTARRHPRHRRSPR